MCTSAHLDIKHIVPVTPTAFSPKTAASIPLSDLSFQFKRLHFLVRLRFIAITIINKANDQGPSFKYAEGAVRIPPHYRLFIALWATYAWCTLQSGQG